MLKDKQQTGLVENATFHALNEIKLHTMNRPRRLRLRDLVVQIAFVACFFSFRTTRGSSAAVYVARHAVLLRPGYLHALYFVMPRAMYRLCLVFVASLALFAGVLDAARTTPPSPDEVSTDPLAALGAHPALPRELRLPVTTASGTLASAGLGPRAVDAIAGYGGTDQVRVLSRGTSGVLLLLPALAQTCHSPFSLLSFKRAFPPPPQVARDLALVLAGATAGCGAGGEGAIQVHTSAASAAATARSLRAVFAGLAHELDLRLYSAKVAAPDLFAAQDPYRVYERSQNNNDDNKATNNHDGVRFIVDELDEAGASLARIAGAGNKNANETSSCFASAGGIVTRTLRALNVLGLPFDELVDFVHAKSSEELTRCGLGAFALGTDEEAAKEYALVVEAATRTRACRLGETDGANALPFFGANLRDVTLRIAASDRALRDVVHAERRARDIAGDGFKGALNVSQRANSRTSCLGDYAPPRDLHWNAETGSELLTATSVFAFLVAAAADVTLTEASCARSLDAPPGVFFASPVVDIVAQEACESGVLHAVLAWLGQTHANTGSAGFELSVDEVAGAAEVCSAQFGDTSSEQSKNATEQPWIKADASALDSTISFLTLIEAVTLGNRRGRYTYSATGKLVDTLRAFRLELEKGGCLSSGSFDGRDSRDSGDSNVTSSTVPVSTPGRVGGIKATSSRIDPAGEISEIEIVETYSNDGNAAPGDDGRAALVGFVAGAGVFCVVATAAVALNARKHKPKSRVGFFTAAHNGSAQCSSDTGNNADSDTPSNSQRNDQRGLLAGGAAGSARRFYRHLEAGSAGDLPLVEDLDLVPSLPGQRSPGGRGSPVVGGSPRSGSPRPTTPPGQQNPYASLFFAPTARRRSHSISEPPGFRAALPPRHERRHTTHVAKPDA